MQPFKTHDVQLTGGGKCLVVDLSMSVSTNNERLERDFFDEYYDLYRRDAMATEHLMHSQYALDIYML
jgi:hypothetical protein